MNMVGRIVSSSLVLLTLILPWENLEYPGSSNISAGGIPVAFAQELPEEPKSRSTSVEAVVPDIIAPTTPILIAPTDDTLTTDSTPTLIWTGSTDNVGVTSYTLFVDGVALFDLLPSELLTPLTTAQYTLSYDSLTNQWSLTPVHGLADGDHTWYVAAYDARGNVGASVPWSFAIDTRAPTFVITQIEDEETEISVDDEDSIPSSPIQLSGNEPVISGTTEPGSSIKLVLRDGDEILDTLEFDADDDGTWEIELPVLPRDTDIELEFTITDSAGLVTILSDLFIRLNSQKTTLPLPGSPTIEIPYIDEIITLTIIHPIQQLFSPDAEPLTSPTPTPQPLHSLDPAQQSSATQIRLSSVPVYEQVRSAGMQLSLLMQILIAAMFLALPIVLKYFTLIFLNRRYISLSLLWVIWLAVWKRSGKAGDSFVLETATTMPLAYILIRLTDAQGKEHTAMSSDMGFVRLPQVSNEWSLRLGCDGTPLPFASERPAHLATTTWYRGETLHPDMSRQALIIATQPHQRSLLYSAILLQPVLAKWWSIVAALLLLFFGMVPAALITLTIILADTINNYVLQQRLIVDVEDRNKALTSPSVAVAVRATTKEQRLIIHSHTITRLAGLEDAYYFITAVLPTMRPVISNPIVIPPDAHESNHVVTVLVEPAQT